MKDWTEYEPRIRYMFLSRMKQDCDYYLGNGGRNPKNLWAGNEAEQIAVMLVIWNSFDMEDKPEWLNLVDIDEYARKMGVK